MYVSSSGVAGLLLFIFLSIFLTEGRRGGEDKGGGHLRKILKLERTLSANLTKENF